MSLGLFLQKKETVMSILNLAIDKLKERLDDACEHGEIGNSERALSVVAGGFIVGFSVKRLLHSPLTAISGLTLGGALVVRGLTGKCAVKGALNEANAEDVTVIEHRYFVK